MASALFEWIWDAITTIIETIFKPIIDAYNEWKNGILDLFDGFKVTGNSQSRAIVNDGVDDYNILPDSIPKFLFSGRFWSVLSGIVIGVQVITAVLGIIIKIVSAGTTEIAQNVMKPIINQMIATSISALTYSAGSFMLFAVYELAGEDHPIWSSSIGIEILAIFAALATYINANILGIEGKTDAQGLLIAFVGMLLTSIGDLVPNILIKGILSFIGLMLAGWGLFDTATTNDGIDRVIGPPLSLIEELISAIAVIYSTFDFFNKFDQTFSSS